MTAEILMSLAGALTVCLSVLLSAFLLLVRSPLSRANRYLAAFFLLTAIDLCGWMAGLFPDGLRSVLVFRLPLAFLQMPMLCAYAQTLHFPERTVGRHLWWGTIAALLSSLSLVPRAVVAIGGATGASSNGFGWVDRAADLVGNEIALHVQFYAYIAFMGVLLLRYRQERRSGARKSGPPPVWLFAILVVSLAAHTLVLAKSWAWIAGFGTVSPVLNGTVGLVAVLVTFAMALTALTQQTLFVSSQAGEETGVLRRRSPGKTLPPDPDAVARLGRYMTMHEPYLDPALTIRTLSRRIGMGQRELSVLINQQMGLHFFDFLNGHRAEKAARMLADPASDHLSVLEIAHAVGFNSKSSFNAAFNKHSGRTPSAHRLEARAASNGTAAPAA